MRTNDEQISETQMWKHEVFGPRKSESGWIFEDGTNWWAVTGGQLTNDIDHARVYFYHLNQGKNLIQLQMDVLDHFEIYKDILEKSIAQIKKINFKRMPHLKDMVDTVEIFLSKEIRGRIVPGNYLLLYLVLLGTRNAKLMEIGIVTVYKLFSFNFIHDNEELTLALLKDQFKEFLLVDLSLLKTRSFKEIYLEMLMQIGEKDQATVLLIAKNLSLIVRMFQHSLDVQNVLSVQEHVSNQVVGLAGRGSVIQKPLMSTPIQILRHVLQNLRELDYNVLVTGVGSTIQATCAKTLTMIVDEIVMGQAVKSQYPEATNWELIPEPYQFKNFKGIQTSKAIVKDTSKMNINYADQPYSFRQ